MSPKSRAEYFKKRREKFKMFTVEIDREQMERLEAHLAKARKTKADWLNEKINETLSQ